MKKPNLADVSLPVHPTLRHPFTGEPLQALGVRRNGAPIWPVIGGSQPLGGPVLGAAQPPAAPGGQPPAGFVPGLGGTAVPVLAPGALPMVPPAMAQPPVTAPGQQPGAVPIPQFMPPGMMPAAGQPPYGQIQYGQQPQYGQPGPMYGQPQYGQQPQQQPPYNNGGWLPPAPFLTGQQPQQQAQQPFPAFPFPANGQQPTGGQQQQNGGQPAGGQGQQPQGGGQQPGQQPQGGGQQSGNGTDSGTWERPYPQGVALDQMTDPQKVEFWKWHARQHEQRLRGMGDYEQVKQQLGQLQQMTQTEWQRAVLEAEQRGTSRAMEQAAGQMVAVAFQGAAQHRMTPDQIHAQLSRMDARSFVVNGQVDIAAIQAHVDTIAPARQTGLVPLLPYPQGQQQLPLQQVPLGQYQAGGVPLQPGQPGYSQQPTFGPLGQPQTSYGLMPSQQPQGQQYPGQVVSGQVMPPGYGPVPIPGVPASYQPATYVPQPVVQAAGLAGLPGLIAQQALPAATDFGQGPAVPNMPANPAQAGAAVAAARHGQTRSQQLAATRGR